MDSEQAKPGTEAFDALLRDLARSDAREPHAKDDLVGRIVGGDFRVESRLREGGMGQVWVAEQLSLGRRRALKVMRRELINDPSLRERFVLEARIGATIDSAHIVEVIAAGIDEKVGLPWLAMELLEGRDLEAAITEEGGLPWADVAKIADQLGHALGAAHAAGVVHRDLKPANIFLARSRRSGEAPFDVKVLDFGIAKLVEGAVATSGQSALIGTPLYMAPEQTEAASSSTPAIDVWALGLIAYRALTGRFFWRSARDGAQSIASILREVLFEPIPLPSELAAADGAASRLPPGFDGWFARCVARDPEARFAEAGEACAALSVALGAAPAPEAASSPAPRRVDTPEATTLPPAIIERIYDGRDFSFGRVAHLLIIRWWRTPTAASAAEMDGVMTRAVRDAVAPLVIVPVMDTSIAGPSADVRDALERVIVKHERSVERVASVVLGSGFKAATLRAVITGMVLANPPRHPMKVYPSVAAAIASLGPSRDRPDASALTAAIERFSDGAERPAKC